MRGMLDSGGASVSNATTIWNPLRRDRSRILVDAPSVLEMCSQ
jgi:hypothetical protein